MSKKSLFSKKQIEYIEAIVYILSVIVVIFCKVYGNIYFSLIPLLVILGIVGSVLFKREIVTTVFGIIVSIAIVYTKGNIDILNNILVSFFVGLDIAMGELLGKYLKKIYTILKKNNKIGKKSLKIYIKTVIIFMLTCIVNTYTNGSILSYNICKENLLTYIDETYKNSKDFQIVDTYYTVGISSYYTFEVYNAKEDYISNYIVYLKNSDMIIDKYKENNFAKNTNDENKKLKEFIKNNNYYNKYKNIDISLHIIEDNVYEIIFEKQVDSLSDVEKETFAKEVVGFIEDLKGYEGYSKINDILICIKDKKNESAISTIYREGYDKNILTNTKQLPYIYILESLTIEYID